MGFSVEDFSDLLRLLSERPEWQAELRQVLLSDDFLTLPQAIRDLVQVQARTEEKLQALAEAQAGVEARLARLEEAQARTEQKLQALADSVAGMEQRLQKLEAAVTGLHEAVASLTEVQRRTCVILGDMRGRLFELEYRLKASAYLGRLLRRLQVVGSSLLDDLVEPHLSPKELDDLLLADLVVRGRPRRDPEVGEVWLVTEVSGAPDYEDIERAVRRAQHLRKAGKRAIPAVVGEWVTDLVREEASRRAVLVPQDGRVSFWREALEQSGS